jgi:metal-responsive CopG/Arc/MetJ family transcriptional regulator
MKSHKGQAASSESGEQAIRASISFPPEVYQTLEEIARQKKVSLAWVVREAAEEYISGKWPLFANTGDKERQQ